MAAMNNVEIPIVNIAPFVIDGSEDEKETVVVQIRNACEGIGFFFIKEHGVSDEIIQKASSIAEKFFNLPPDSKNKCIKGSGSGYLPEGAENLSVTLGNSAPFDLKESFNVNSKLEKNVWPTDLPEFQNDCKSYFNEMVKLASTLIKIFALALGLSENYFEEHITPLCAVLRFLNYPAQTEEPLPGQLRAAAHTDYGTLTIVLPDSPGLQVSDGNEGWIDVNAPPGTFIVNLGDIMQRWTNNKWKSTLHRVINPVEGCDERRQSIVFFHNPNDDAMIKCLDVCCTTDNPARYKPELARNLRRNKSHKSRENGAEKGI
jgi:isopenicillin N synthase-like dioxygenase